MSEHRRALDAVTGIPASAGFCEPVEGYADSPMSITATVKAMAYEVGRLNKQLAAAKEENERVRQANLHTMDVFEDMKAAKEKAEARVAELEKAGRMLSFSEWKKHLEREDVQECGHVVYRSPAEKSLLYAKYRQSCERNLDSLLFRKQAEAVEKFGQEIGVFDSDYDDQEYVEIPRREVKAYAQRLRLQADEAERAGGEK